MMPAKKKSNQSSRTAPVALREYAMQEPSQENHDARNAVLALASQQQKARHPPASRAALAQVSASTSSTAAATAAASASSTAAAAAAASIHPQDPAPKTARERLMETIASLKSLAESMSSRAPRGAAARNQSGLSQPVLAGADDDVDDDVADVPVAARDEHTLSDHEVARLFAEKVHREVDRAHFDRHYRRIDTQIPIRRD